MKINKASRELLCRDKAPGIHEELLSAGDNLFLEKKRLKIYKINNAKDVLKRRKQYFPHQRLLLTLKQDKKKIISKHIMVTC